MLSFNFNIIKRGARHCLLLCEGEGILESRDEKRVPSFVEGREK
jgi:hypothetical protein